MSPYYREPAQPLARPHVSFKMTPSFGPSLITYGFLVFMSLISIFVADQLYASGSFLAGVVLFVFPALCFFAIVEDWRRWHRKGPDGKR